MATNIFSKITQRGTIGVFKEKLNTIPQIWQKLAQIVPSTAPDEEHVWLGNVASPREFISGRNLIGIRDFTYNVANKEYELTYLIDQTSGEDDVQGLVAQRIAEMAQVWVVFKDVLLAALMNDGQTSGNNSFDGVTFFNDSHVIGKSTSPPSSTTDVDNLLATDVTAPTALTLAEMQAEMRKGRLFLQGVTDDTGREGYNWTAMSQIVFMGNQQFEQRMQEALASTLLGGGDSNPFFLNMGDGVINPYLGLSNDYFYTAAVGDKSRMPIIYQERTPLQIEVFNGEQDVALNHGLLVMARQRFRMAYGEPRRMCVSLLT